MKKNIFVYSPSNGLANLSSKKNNPYDVVEDIRLIWKSNLVESKPPFAQQLLSEILPIHNLSGIRDLSQIKQMQQEISLGREITEKDGLPNVKLVLAPNGKLLLFDGTHTLLAYYFEGKKKLGEIPYLVISVENNEPITSEEIANFFPEEEREKVIKVWEKYVVNWLAEKGKQLELRNVNSIGELAAQLGEADKSSVEK